MKVKIYLYYIKVQLLTIIEHGAKFKAQNRHRVYINVIEIEEGGGNIAEWRCPRFKGDVDLFKTSSKQRKSVGNSGRNCNRERRVHAGRSKELYR